MDRIAPEGLTFPPGRADALARLSRFLPRAGRDYAAGRNYDLPEEGHPHVSGLSPYLRHRLILEEEVLRAVTARWAPSTAEKFLQEVVWRTYWKGWLEMRPGVWAGVPRGAGPRARRPLRRGCRARCRRRGRRDRDRRLRRLDARAAPDRLPAQSRPDVGRVDLDLHPRAAVADRGGPLHSSPSGRGSGLEHAGLALGGRGCRPAASPTSRGPRTFPSSPADGTIPNGG